MMAQPRPLKIPAIRPIPKGLVLWLPFDERSGVKAYDRSGKGNHGTLNLPAWGAGKNCSALIFDGIDDYVSVANSSSITFTNKATLSAMFRVDVDTGTYQAILSKGSSFYEWRLLYDKTRRLLLAQWILDNSAYGNSYTVNLALGSYHHFASTYDGSTIRQYLNGIAIGTPAIVAATIANLDQELRIGKTFNTYYPFKGAICDVMIFNRALNANEISRLAQGGRLRPR